MEIEVVAYIKRVVRIAPVINYSVAYGEPSGLPETVKVLFNDATFSDAPVIWSGFNAGILGEQEVTGTVTVPFVYEAGVKNTVTVKVTVTTPAAAGGGNCNNTAALLSLLPLLCLTALGYIKKR